MITQKMSFPRHMLLAAATVMLSAGVAAAQQNPDADASGYWLRLTGDPVNVRSRADTNSVPVARLPRDTVLRAFEEQYGWHRVAPPAGTFSLVSADYVDVGGDGVGTINVASGTLRVRVGSQVIESDPRIREVQTRLDAGAKVRILGRQDGWYKIAPPEGVYFYVSSDFSEIVSEQQARELASQQRVSLDRRVDQPGAVQAADVTPTKHDNADGAVDAPPARPMEQLRPLADTDNAASGTPPTDVAGEVQGRGFNEATPAAPAAPAAIATWLGRLIAWEPEMLSDLRLPPNEARDRTWVQRLQPIAQQREDAVAADRAAFWIIRFDQRTPQSRPSEPLQRPSEFPEMQARGVLYPSFQVPAGPYGLRYRLVEPHTNRVVGYAEFDPQRGVNPRELIGKYVGVSGEPFEEPTQRVQVIRVWSTTILSTAGGKSRDGGG